MELVHIKRSILGVFLFVSSLMQAQNFEDLWTDYFSYVSIKDISQGDDQIFVAAENAVFIYDLSTEEITTISSVQGLSGEAISAMHYSQETDLLTIGYENGLIEVVNTAEDYDVLKVVDILDKLNIPPNTKRINHFTENEGKLYVSTQFGISVYDLERLEFGDTYFIGDGGMQIDISQTTIALPYIYAATTENGIRRAILEDDNIIDFANWETVVSGNFIGIQTLGTRVLAANSNNRVFRLLGGTTPEQVAAYANNIQDFEVNNALLTVTTTEQIFAYSQGFIQEASVTSLPDFDYNLQSGYSFGNYFYLGTTEQGLLRVPFSSTLAEQILPDGPLFNQPFAVDATAGQLWVSFGAVTVDFNPNPTTRKGVSRLNEEQWTNFKHDDIAASLGADRINNIVEVTINPEEPDQVYFSSFLSGLLRFENQEPSVLYNENNSPLENPIFGGPAGVRLYGSDFDRDGNLWFLQTLVDDALVKLSPTSQFQRIDVSNISGGREELAYSQLAISRENYVFFGGTPTGLIGYNPSNGQLKSIGEGEGPGAGLPSSDIRALAFDAQNRLWIGTLRGLRVLFNPGSFFNDGTEPEAQSIIFEDDEGVGQELLFEQIVTSIVVDGSNNKWIGTSTSGVFLLSSNGQETLLRFTDENSPLPSNNIQDIAIDPFTGVVYFATLNGLVAYKGSATAPRDNLEEVFAFPNPVRPGFEGNVTIDGLTENANVKITDLEGNLVFQKTSEGGSVQWDTRAFGRYKVASGVYMVLITSEDALETTIKKIMIVR